MIVNTQFYTKYRSLVLYCYAGKPYEDRTAPPNGHKYVSFGGDGHHCCRWRMDVGTNCGPTRCWGYERGVRDNCVTVFAFGAYVETTGMFLPGDISCVLRAMPHNSPLDIYPLLYVLYCLFLHLVFHSVVTSTSRVPSPLVPVREPTLAQPTILRGISTR